MTITIPPYVKAVLETLTNAGHHAVLVGGCIRDLIMGRNPKDWDIATSAKPEQVQATFDETIPTGIAFGTITVMSGGNAVEVTTFRQDGAYTNGRRPTGVSFQSDIYEDLRRRDFTMNAIAYSTSHGFVDPFHGRKDIEARIIRCVGDAKQRFFEDRLRVLRALRFASQLEFSIETKTLVAMRGINFEGVSAERKGAELLKLLDGEAADAALQIGAMVGALPPSSRFDGTDASFSYLPARVALLLPNDTTNVAFENMCTKEYRLSSYVTRYAVDMRRLAAKWNRTFVHFDPVEIRQFLSDCRNATVEWYHPLEIMDASTDSKYRVREIAEENPPVIIEDLALSGGDVSTLTGSPGRHVGVILKKLLASVIEDPQRNTREQLTALVHQYKGAL